MVQLRRLHRGQDLIGAEPLPAVLICGAGPAGLAVALFAARRGQPVTIVEPDPPPPAGTADQIVSAWSRKGVPHARQGHVFLARGVDILRHRAPDVLAELAVMGARLIPVDKSRPTAHQFLQARRLLWEACLYRAVAADSAIRIIQERVAGFDLETSTDPSRPAHVAAVRLRSGQHLRAGFYIDAMGRHSPSQRLVPHGQPWPTVDHPCGIRYLCRSYHRPPGRELPTTDIPIITDLGHLSLLIFPGDHDHVQVSLAVARTDPLQSVMRTDEGFEAICRSMPITHRWLVDARSEGHPEPMSGLRNRWREQVRGTQALVDNLISVGDAHLQTNPTNGRGITWALMQAAAVADQIEHAQRPGALAHHLHSWTRRHLQPLFNNQVDADIARERRRHRTHDGPSHGRPDEGGLWTPNRSDDPLTDALTRLYGRDPAVTAASHRIFHQLADPTELLSDPAVARRLVHEARHPTPLPPVGPTRTELESILTTVYRQGPRDP